MATVWVTGAYGFLGRHVAQHYASKGWKVVGLGRGLWTQREAEQWGVTEWFGGDLTPSMLDEVTGTPDVVVHCAGGASVGRSQQNPEKDFRDTVETTVSLLHHLRLKAPEARLVLPSSAAVYGDTSSREIGEEASANPVSPYGVHKKAAEDACREQAATHGTQAVIIRFFSVYGPGLAKQLLFDACRKARDGEFSFFGTGDESRDFLHVSDAVGLIEVATKHASAGCPVVNGGTGRGVSVREIVSSIAKHWQPAPLPEFNGEVRSGDPKHLVAKMDKAHSWGFHPSVDLQTGIDGYVAWFREAIL